MTKREKCFILSKNKFIYKYRINDEGLSVKKCPYLTKEEYLELRGSKWYSHFNFDIVVYTQANGDTMRLTLDQLNTIFKSSIYMMERNDELAKQIFNEYLDNNIKEAKNTIKKENAKKKRIENIIESVLTI